MNIALFVFLLFALQAICLYVGGRSSKGMSTKEDYFLAGKGVRFFPLMMTFVATQVGGGLILGSAEEAYKFGWAVLFYPLGASLGFILLGLGVGKKLAQLPISTTAQIFELIYRSSKLKKVASMLSITTLFLTLVAQIVGSNKFMASLGAENQIIFIAFWAMVIIYTALGGLKAVISTDIIQVIFFLAVFSMSFIFAANLAESSAWQIINDGFSSNEFDFDTSKLSGWLLMPLLFMVIEQSMGQRCFAADNPKTVSKATLWAGICTLFVSIIPVFFGVYAKSSGLVIPAGASVLMLTIVQKTSPVIAAFVACAIVAAIISTADSLINAIGSNLAQDFDVPALKNKNIKISQALSAGIAIAALCISYFFNNIVDLLIISYELSVSCLFVPVIFGVFKKYGNASSATLAIILGGISFITFKIYPTSYPQEIISLLSSFIGYSIGELLARRNAYNEVSVYE